MAKRRSAAAADSNTKVEVWKRGVLSESSPSSGSQPLRIISDWGSDIPGQLSLGSSIQYSVNSAQRPSANRSRKQL